MFEKIPMKIGVSVSTCIRIARLCCLFFA